MIDWKKRLELQAVLNKIRVYEQAKKSHASLLLGYTGDFLVFIQFGMLIDYVWKKNMYTKMVFEISRQ